jgi:hypothetical protein
MSNQKIVRDLSKEFISKIDNYNIRGCFIDFKKPFKIYVEQGSENVKHSYVVYGMDEKGLYTSDFDIPLSDIEVETLGYILDILESNEFIIG